MSEHSPVTPVMMPSAQKLKRPHLPSIMAGKAFTADDDLPMWTPNGWKHSYRSTLNVPLPPLEAQPVTMPSFAKSLSGIKQANGRDDAEATNAVKKQQSFEDNTQPKTLVLPLVASNPGSVPQKLSSTSLPAGPTRILNPAKSLQPPAPAYQIVGMIPSQPPCYPVYGNSQAYKLPQDYMVSAVTQHQIVENLPSNYPPAYFQPQLFAPLPPPYMAQSLPCLGSTQNTHATTHTEYISTKRTHWNQKTGITLPSIPELNEPVYSTSMPEISFGSGDSLPQAKAPVLFRLGKLPSQKNDDNQVPNCRLVTNVGSVTEERQAGENSEINNSRYKVNFPPSETATLGRFGPDSKPEQVPSNPRVVRTPENISWPINDGNVREQKADQAVSTTDFMKYVAACGKMAKNRLSTAEKLKELKNTLSPSPRKKKPVVVAVHECFSSDSSSNQDSDKELSNRKNSFNHYVRNNTAIRKRKPRIDTNPKGKADFESCEVFEDLYLDLNLEEVRIYTEEYIADLLNSQEWDNCHEALQVIARLARHRPKALISILGEPIIWLIFSHITSPRSALCRAAIVTFREMFETVGPALEPALDKIIEKLILKSLAPNTFIREECDRALKAMISNCNIAKVLTAMELTVHKSCGRAASSQLARMALLIIHVAGVDACVKPNYAEKLLPMLFKFMTEANNTTRYYLYIFD